MNDIVARKRVGKTHEVRLILDNMGIADSPRDWDNMGTLVGFVDRYRLSDRHEFDGNRQCTPFTDRSQDDFLTQLFEKEITGINEAIERYAEDPDEAQYIDYFSDLSEIQQEAVVAAYKGVLLSFYFHTYDGHCFAADFDLGNWERADGFVYVTPEHLAVEYHEHGTYGEEARELAKRCSIGEIKTFSHWSEGNVYGVTIVRTHYHKDGCYGEETTDSLWGFYGEDDGKEQADEFALGVLPDRVHKRFKALDWEYD